MTTSKAAPRKVEFVGMTPERLAKAVANDNEVTRTKDGAQRVADWPLAALHRSGQLSASPRQADALLAAGERVAELHFAAFGGGEGSLDYGRVRVDNSSRYYRGGARDAGAAAVLRWLLACLNPKQGRLVLSVCCADQMPRQSELADLQEALRLLAEQLQRRVRGLRLAT